MDKKHKALEITANVFLSIGIALCVAVIIFKLLFINVIVDGKSMNPSILDGSKGYMLKVNTKTKIKRFDVVVSEYGTSKDYYIIKRVLGLPNETITLKDNVLSVNGKEVEQPFDFIPRQFNFKNTEWTLKDDEYLLVGDNRALTIEPAVEPINKIIARNGFSIGNEENKNWYWFNSSKKGN